VKNYEYKVKISDDKDGYIDYFELGKIAVEMKSIGKNLDKAYAQLKEYMTAIPAEDYPEILMVCDLRNIVIYRPELKDVIKFPTRKLHRYTKYFYTLSGAKKMPKDDDEIELNIKASYLMASLHDKLKGIGYTGHELEVYLCRILFCLFADKTQIFPNNNFQNYIKESDKTGTNLATRLEELFEILNTDENKRLTTISPELKAFRYINGGLFAERLHIAGFDYKMRAVLLDCCKFNWEEILPSIFGTMFQAIMDEQKRREIGAHYTSEENILKVLNPLFLDDLWSEFNKVKSSVKTLENFHNYVAGLKFLEIKTPNLIQLHYSVAKQKTA
jgi:type II restriction/modification system DNA methylase subunit YeeA